ncbi:diguanylate cyclase [Sphingobium terrigena]|uniref:diguanylate cyclase n=1 Tax=Sphingobium terrigena TaxID=2304063 RepID=A0A418YLC6_9SPHN|nr:diguanylate cyclase [Sphingobium terrigena]RJG51761.1 diguanylate cyclase [Sphingobium terrigena]
MRLATITNWAYGTTVLLTLASATTMLLASGAQEKERAAVAQRYQLDQATSKIAAEVSASNDEARDFVITGEESHLAAYRREAEALRSVENRARHLKDNGASADELSALSEAMRWADSLQDEQVDAIAARQRGDDDRAREILFGAEYQRGLDRVTGNIERFQYRLDQRTDAEVVAATTIARIWKTSSEIVLGLTAFLSLCVLYFIFKRRVLHPVVRLSDVVGRLARQDYAVEAPEYDQIDEIGDMAQAIRIFRENGLERQRLEAERAADQAMRALLSRMTQRMQGCDTMHDLERVVSGFMPEIAPGLSGRLYRLDESRNIMVERCAWLAPTHSRPEFSPMACWALQRGDLHRPRGQLIDIPCDHVDPQGNIDVPSICLPLIAQRVTLGLLYLEPRADLPEPRTDIGETYLRVLAENIGLALGNLRLRDALREMAMADPLTGLANRRQLDMVLEVQLAEADRLGRPISCLMLDVDHFKRFNDQFGHDAGDAVLRALGKILLTITREHGLAFRYGGEEFLLLMPELDAEQACQRAEDIRARVKALRMQHDGRELGPITVSVGMACAPLHCRFDTLVKTADAALLRAKEAGRDRIVVAETRRLGPRAV